MGTAWLTGAPLVLHWWGARSHPENGHFVWFILAHLASRRVPHIEWETSLTNSAISADGSYYFELYHKCCFIILLIIIYDLFSENKPKAHICGLSPSHMLMGNNVKGLTVELAGFRVCPRCADTGDAVPGSTGASRLASPPSGTRIPPVAPPVAPLPGFPLWRRMLSWVNGCHTKELWRKVVWGLRSIFVS